MCVIPTYIYSTIAYVLNFSYTIFDIAFPFFERYEYIVNLYILESNDNFGACMNVGEDGISHILFLILDINI